MMEIVLSQGKVALIDEEDFELVSKYKWCYTKTHNGNNYAKTNIGKFPKQKPFLMHNLILNRKYIDHKNNNGLDNRRSNLRPCDQSQNQANRKKIEGTISKFKGVSWYKKARKWYAYISKKPNRYYLGCFKDEIDAAKAYDIKAIELFGEFARTNLIAA